MNGVIATDGVFSRLTFALLEDSGCVQCVCSVCVYSVCVCVCVCVCVQCVCVCAVCVQCVQCVYWDMVY